MSRSRPAVSTRRVGGLGPVEQAVGASLVANVVVQLLVFLPAVGDDVPSDAKVVGVAFAVVAAIGAWGLWNRRTWGRRTTLAITVLNVLSSVPALIDPPGAAVLAAVVVSILFGIVAIALLLSGGVKGELAQS